MKTNPLRYRDLHDMRSKADLAYLHLENWHRFLYGRRGMFTCLCLVFGIILHFVTNISWYFLLGLRSDPPMPISIGLPIFVLLGLFSVLCNRDEAVMTRRLERFAKKHSNPLTTEEKDLVFDFLRSAASGVDEIVVPTHLLQSLKDKNVIFETNLYDSKEITTFLQHWALDHFSRQRGKEEQEAQRLQKAMTK